MSVVKGLFSSSVPRRNPSLEEIDALEYIVIPSGEPVELLPRCSEIIAQQLKLVKSYQLAVENSSTDLNPRLQILPQKLNKKSGKNPKPSSGFIAPTGDVAARGGFRKVLAWVLARL
ncbi:hypothetical protein Lser_V15G09722 [Lactuca serriola]